MIRWMIRRDMDQVKQISRLSFLHFTGEEEFLKMLRQRNCIGMVQHTDKDFDTINGYMIYELHKSYLRVLEFAVSQFNRREGVGSELIYKLKSKLSVAGRKEVRFWVGEDNLVGQLFLKRHGFVGVCNSTRGINFSYSLALDSGSRK